MASGYNDRVTCPYNNSCNPLRHRLQTHLVKCEKQYPNSDLVKCPLNSTHRIRKVDLHDHLKNCESLASIDLFKYKIVPISQLDEGKTPSPEPTFSPLPEDSENWDDEDVRTYNPQEYVERAPVIRQLNVAPPAARRAFREAERLRHSQIKK